MKLFWISCAITCKRVLKDPVYIIVLLLLTATTLLACLSLGKNAPVVHIRAGLIFDSSDIIAAQVYESLPVNPAIHFEPYAPEDREQVEALVRTGGLDCAYILGDNLVNALANGKVQGAMTLLKSPGTRAAPILGEMLFSAVLEVASPQISTAQILRLFEDDPALVRQRVDALMAQYNSGDANAFSTPDARYIGTETASAPVNPLAGRLVHGIVALYMLAMFLFFLPRFIREKAGGLWSGLGCHGLLCYYGGMWASLTLLGAGTGLLALAIIKLTAPTLLSLLMWEALLLLIYCAALAMASVLLIVLLPTPDFITTATIFLLLLTLVVGGILLDWSELSPSIAALSALFPTQRYINGAVFRNAADLLWLLGSIGITGIMTALRLRLYKPY